MGATHKRQGDVAVGVTTATDAAGTKTAPGVALGAADKTGEVADGMAELSGSAQHLKSTQFFQSSGSHVCNSA
jgi:hypothetical protein